MDCFSPKPSFLTLTKEMTKFMKLPYLFLSFKKSESQEYNYCLKITQFFMKSSNHKTRGPKYKILQLEHNNVHPHYNSQQTSK